MNIIREARLAAGLTQQKMSDDMQIPKRTIEDWEAGRRKCPAYVERMVLRELNEIAREKKHEQT